MKYCSEILFPLGDSEPSELKEGKRRRNIRLNQQIERPLGSGFSRVIKYGKVLRFYGTRFVPERSDKTFTFLTKIRN